MSRIGTVATRRPCRCSSSLTNRMAVCVASTRVAAAPSCWNVVRGSRVCVALGIGSTSCLGLEPAPDLPRVRARFVAKQSNHITFVCLLETKISIRVICLMFVWCALRCAAAQIVRCAIAFAFARCWGVEAKICSASPQRGFSANYVWSDQPIPIPSAHLRGACPLSARERVTGSVEAQLREGCRQGCRQTCRQGKCVFGRAALSAPISARERKGA
jgi:hypothetical protein